ncbi:MAG: NUDIX domain-containing protein [Candidatus Hodarchaeales archaeon]
MPYPKEAACHFIGVGGVIIYNNQILLVKLTYGPATGMWLIPGGLVDPGETLNEAVIREIYEETGQRVIPLGIIGVRSMVRESDNLTDLYCIFLCQIASELQPLKRDRTEIKEISWISLDELESDPTVTDYTRLIVRKALKSNPMIHDKERDQLIISRLSLRNYEHFWI